MRTPALALALALAAAPAVADEVYLRAESAVPGAYFTLGEIAEVHALDSRAQALRDLRVGRSPRAGGVLALERGAVQRWLQRAQAGVRVLGAETAVVRRGPLRELGFDEVRTEAERALRRALAAAYEDLALDAPAGRALLVPAGDVRLSARPPAPLAEEDRATVWVNVAVDGEHYQSVPLVFGVRGQRVGGPGFDVRRAQALRVLATVGAVAVETAAVAMRDARAGEVIRVRGDAGETYAVRVLAPGVAVVAGAAR
jgi:hypothetical protein